MEIMEKNQARSLKYYHSTGGNEKIRLEVQYIVIQMEVMEKIRLGV